MALPLQLFPGFRNTQFDNNGEICADGEFRFFITATTTPLNVYSDQTGGTSLGSVVALSAAGVPPPIYLQPTGYLVELWNDSGAGLVKVRDVPYVANVGTNFVNQFGVLMSAGSKSVSSLPYAVVPATDNYVTIDSATAGQVVLPLTSDWVAENGNFLAIVNESNNSGANVTVVTTSPDTINSGANGSQVVLSAAFATPGFPYPRGVVFITSGNGNWLIFSLFIDQ